MIDLDRQAGNETDRSRYSGDEREMRFLAARSVVGELQKAQGRRLDDASGFVGGA